jgi:hypothetical protein
VTLAIHPDGSVPEDGHTLALNVEPETAKCSVYEVPAAAVKGTDLSIVVVPFTFF